MLTAWIQARARGARPLGTANLERFRLRWNKRSRDGSAKCSVEETGRPEDVVLGVLYGLDVANKKLLDSAEGIGRGYGERSVMVIWNGNRLRVLTYYATSIDPHAKPYDWYRDLVVAGAREHALPNSYIEKLQSIEVISDTDPAREGRARQVLK